MPSHFNPLDHPILLSQPRRLTGHSAWNEHIPAAMLLVDLIKPRTFVELGAYYGDSYCAFCQAVQELHLRTECFAVDTWQGDQQTGAYGPEVLAQLRAHHDPLYASFSALVQSTFDEALAHFPDGTIDLLHIDGYHTFEAVKHDFECWSSKLSTRGVVLFHDINVREGDFGVWRLWDDLAAIYPHFEFTHGHGLGVLSFGKDQAAGLEELLETSEEERLAIRNLLFQLGQRLEFQSRVAKEEATRGQTVKELSAVIAEKDQKAIHLSAQDEKNQAELHRLNELVSEKDRIAIDLSVRDEENQAALQQQNKLVAEKDEALRAVVQDREQDERRIESLLQTLQEQNEHNKSLVERADFLSAREAEVRRLLLDAQSQLVERDNEIQRLQREGAPPFPGIEAASKHFEYRRLIGRIRSVVIETLPPKARVIVVSKGDEELLKLNGCEAWHFPRRNDGVYTGYYPADSEAAIAHLEELRARGGEYLLFPNTAFWWMDHYAELGRYLEDHYRMVANRRDACIIYSLTGRPENRRSRTGTRRTPTTRRNGAKR